MGETLQLVDIARMSDDELMKMSNKEFVEAMIEKSKLFGTDMFNRDHYRAIPMSKEERRQALIRWNQRHAWLEWWLGVTPPARQIVSLGEEDMPIKILLAQQIVDEVKHQRVFSKRVMKLGGDPKLDRYQPGAIEREMYEMTFLEHPLDIAASLQCTGEGVLLHYAKPEENIIYQMLDEDTLEDIANDVAPDEPRHVKNGEDLYKKYASTPEIRRRVARVQDRKLETLARHYVEDHAILGFERIAPIPIIPKHEVA